MQELFSRLPQKVRSLLQQLSTWQRMEEKMKKAIEIAVEIVICVGGIIKILRKKK